MEIFLKLKIQFPYWYKAIQDIFFSWVSFGSLCIENNICVFHLSYQIY